MADTKKTASLGAAIADKLLDLLSSDDDFRQRFQADPLGALESIGYRAAETGANTLTPALAQPFSACQVLELASKEQIAQAREELRATLVQGLAYNTPTLEAGTFERRTRK